ncbi:MAG: hypothetical protein JF615_02985 [Asticcacaulis sp.]|nr:hypothetical protein [Asticcacaulis sp.]
MLRRALLSLLAAACALTAVDAAAAPPAPGSIAAQPDAAHKQTIFTIVTNGGFVRFPAGEDWTVLDMQPYMPVAAAVFQIPDSADAGTGDSSNMIVGLYKPGDASADNGFAAIGQQLGETAPTIETHGAWRIYRQTAAQGETEYSILDARSRIADVNVGIRMAWPHLKDQPADHEDAMRTLFLNELDGITGATGPYALQSDDVVRRLDGQ